MTSEPLSESERNRLKQLEAEIETALPKMRTHAINSGRALRVAQRHFASRKEWENWVSEEFEGGLEVAEVYIRWIDDPPTNEELLDLALKLAEKYVAN